MGDSSAQSRRRLPPWLVGFLIAAVLFAVILLVSRLFGFGDDPVVEGLGFLELPA